MAVNLETPIQYLKGVGPRMAQRLAKLGIKTVEDLIHHYPTRYEDYSLVVPIATLQEGERVTIHAKIVAIKNEYTKTRKQIQKAIVEDESGQLEVIWFNQPFLLKTLSAGSLVALSGKVYRRGGRLQLVSPDYEILTPDNFGGKTRFATVHTGRLVPIYPCVQGVTSKYLRRLIARSLPLVINQVEEILPQQVLVSERLLPQRQAILNIHLPESKKMLAKAKERLAFNEALFAQLRVLTSKKQWQEKQPAPPIRVDKQTLQKFITHLPFALTGAQERAIGEILADLQKPVAMNRLLQGDVGSGKTVVAAAAILAALQNGFSAALMVPTELLAFQHQRNLAPLLEPFGIKILLATRTRKPTPSKTPCLVIGTQALLHRTPLAPKIALVVIDEQHRFGVLQRGALVEKAKIASGNKANPHILTMTATPIPRTVALTLYGDLDISILDEMPPGRKPVTTFIVPPSKRKACYQWIKKRVLGSKKVGKPEAVFVICPLIEESETLVSVKAAVVEYQRLSQEVFPELAVGLLHGRLPAKKKEEVLLAFARGELDVLVATPVVEVGIDIPQATIMVIEGAQRFGLAQLHQLRGRVGRGGQKAYCFLFADKMGAKTKKRLAAMERFHDGLKLAEIDLEIRGPGEIYGTKQHGFPQFKLVSFTDFELIQRARRVAEFLLVKDSTLAQYPQLAQKVRGKGTVLPN